MNENLLDLSGKIDPLTIELLETVSRAADSINVPFFVIGATARDIILTHGYGINTIRATYDIDLGVQVSGWEAFNALREALFATGLFSNEREPQRIKFREQLLLDLLPFGAITMPNGRLSWPPHHDVEMNTLGFEGAYSSSLTARLKSDPVFEVRLASLAGLTVMKIISWGDRHYERHRDAQDLWLLMRTYSDAGNQDRLFSEEHLDLAEKEGADYVVSGARLLGRDMAGISAPATVKAILDILDRETGDRDKYRLVEAMATPGESLDPDQGFEKRLGLLEALKSGILDRP
jgi:predicted nucleotidyltransferase